MEALRGAPARPTSIAAATSSPPRCSFDASAGEKRRPMTTPCPRRPFFFLTPPPSFRETLLGTTVGMTIFSRSKRAEAPRAVEGRCVDEGFCCAFRCTYGRRALAEEGDVPGASRGARATPEEAGEEADGVRKERPTRFRGSASSLKGGEKPHRKPADWCRRVGSGSGVLMWRWHHDAERSTAEMRHLQPRHGLSTPMRAGGGRGVHSCQAWP